MTITLTPRAIRFRSIQATAGCSVTASRIAMRNSRNSGQSSHTAHRPKPLPISLRMVVIGTCRSRRAERSHVDHA